MDLTISSNELINAAFISALIFFARIIDVSVGTLRIILVSKGIKKAAPIIGFVESLVWIVAVAQIMQNLTNVLNYFVFAAGFGAGTWFGMMLEEKLSIGKVALRIITRREADELLEILLEYKDIYLTNMDAEGRYGHVKIIFLVVDRKRVPKIIKTIHKYNPRAFYTIEDVRFVNEIPVRKLPHPSIYKPEYLRRLFGIRK